MAKKEQVVQSQEAQEVRTSVDTGSKAGGAAIVLPSGERRIDYIRRRWAEGAKRGEIAKELGVKYQIVFAATKAAKPAEGEAAAA